jgi:hypothetical protein
LSFVSDHTHAFLYIRPKDTMSHCLDIHYQVWNMLIQKVSTQWI